MSTNNVNEIIRGCITIGRMAPDFTTLSTDGVIKVLYAIKAFIALEIYSCINLLNSCK